MISKKPFILTSVGIGLLLAWNVISSLLAQVSWGGVAGCVTGYQAGDWLSRLLSGN
jgi:hydrogenase/urease accessory protein HupE